MKNKPFGNDFGEVLDAITAERIKQKFAAERELDGMHSLSRPNIIDFGFNERSNNQYKKIQNLDKQINENNMSNTLRQLDYNPWQLKSIKGEK